MLCVIIINGKRPFFHGLIWKLHIKHMLHFLQGFSSKPITLDLGKMLAVNIYKFDTCVVCHNPSRMAGEQKMNNSSCDVQPALPLLSYHLSDPISHLLRSASPQTKAPNTVSST